MKELTKTLSGRNEVREAVLAFVLLALLLLTVL